MQTNFPDVKLVEVFDLVNAGYLEYPYLGSIAIDCDEDSEVYKALCEKYGNPYDDAKVNNAVFWVISYDEAKKFYDEKVEFFKLLVKVGFKEIEVGFPAASETEYTFLRTLIENDLIPDDVTIQVLTQAREHIIKKTFEALKGAKRAIVHVYNSTSVAQREQVFKKSKEEIMKIATDGAKLLKRLADETDGNLLFEYSPESFTGTEIDYALDVCNAVLDVWQPRPCLV